MLKKILVANRGEIACRVFATAKRMGIATVAVHSDVDADALHVEYADEVVSIGGTTAAESYLVMGDKITSKRLSADAGVSTVPGHMDLIDNAEHCAKISKEIGYPVMIKASAGGGGKGMRIAWNDDEAKEGFDRSKSEAQSSFGDDRIFVEKFITDPRHIEIQVMADNHGNVVYLGERECSIQRRNQKVIEEAPSPFLDEATRKAMGEQSVALSKAVNYSGAGTVEFVVDSERNFYFLEMNTRLQVEHPVTELITGIDLVEQMIRVASGEKLSIVQDDVKLNGWAIEARLYAEDPTRNFLPATGRVVRYEPPVGSLEFALPDADQTLPVTRCDSGIAAGGEISMFYDPMIAKLCTWAPTRAGAIDHMAQALDQFELKGSGDNLKFLSAIVEHPRFKSGEISTAFIAEEYPDGFMGVEPDAKTIDAFVAVTTALAQIDHQLCSPLSMGSGAHTGSSVLAGERTLQPSQHVVRMERTNYPVSWVMGKTDEHESSTLHVQLKAGPESSTEGVHTVVTDWHPGDSVCFASVNGVERVFQVVSIAGGFTLQHRGCVRTTRLLSEHKATLADRMIEKEPEDTSNYLLCPMPGLLVALQVKEGDTVEEGQALAIVEAMKMENVLTAERSGTVASIPTKEGQSLSVDEVILEFEK